MMPTIIDGNILFINNKLVQPSFDMYSISKTRFYLLNMKYKVS